MEEAIRVELATIKHNISELNSVVRALQELVQEHRQKIETLQKPLRDPAHVQPLS